MKNIAIIESGIVINIIVCEDDFEIENSIEYDESNPAFIGGTYDGEYFYAPQPYPSWTADKGKWICPVPKPNDSQDYSWDEENGQWNVIS